MNNNYACIMYNVVLEVGKVTGCIFACKFLFKFIGSEPFCKERKLIPFVGDAVFTLLVM